MNVWRLTAANQLSRIEEKVPESVPGKMKVRITKVLVGATDAALYSGEAKSRYPLTLGRFAIGIVAEDSPSPLFLKGSRVLLHTFLPAPYSGTEKKDFTEDEMLVCGYSRDGYLRDFVFRGAEEMTPLSDNITDAEALLAHYVAFAKAAVDKLNPEVGDHVAVIGANLLGNLISQLLIYQQAVPVLIDNKKERLETAKRCGVDYTVLCDESVVDNLAQITGGRLASGAIVVSKDMESELSPFTLCAKNSRVIFSHLHGLSINVNLEQAIKKQLTVCGISDVTGYMEAALNLIAGRAVNLSSVETKTSPVDNAAQVLANFPANGDREMAVLDLI